MPSQIEVRQEVAHRLKTAREKAGFVTAEDFCVAYGLSIKNYLQHEDAKTVIRASTAMEYAKLLNTSLQWLMIGDNWQNHRD